MKTTYKKHYVQINCKYICSCGNKMYRKNRDYFTLSPFNGESYEDNLLRLKNILLKKTRNCNLCGQLLKPEEQEK